MKCRPMTPRKDTTEKKNKNRKLSLQVISANFTAQSQRDKKRWSIIKKIVSCVGTVMGCVGKVAVTVVRKKFLQGRYFLIALVQDMI